MASEASRIRNPIADRTCEYCGKIFQYPIGARNCELDNKLERAPTFKPGDRLTLDPKVYANLFPQLEPESNLFAIVGSLFDKKWDPSKQCFITVRTMNCLIRSDSENHKHFYEVRVRLLGDASLKDNRLVYVRATDLKDLAAPSPEPKPDPVADGQ